MLPYSNVGCVQLHVSGVLLCPHGAHHHSPHHNSHALIQSRHVMESVSGTKPVNCVSPYLHSKGVGGRLRRKGHFRVIEKKYALEDILAVIDCCQHVSYL